MPGIDVHPVTPDRWDDLVRLAGEQGFWSGCWCMWWRLTNQELAQQSADQARAALQRLVAEGREPGLLAYRDGEAVGWVSVAPRQQYRRIERTQKLQPVDDRPAWAVVCFYVPREHRRTGVVGALLAAAVDHARARGAELLEGYPVDPAAGRRVTGARLATGTLPVFERAGFVEVARRGGRPIVRKQLR
jgi:GNAT superfamily N-acetyltransferase